MKSSISLILILLIFTSCEERYEFIDPSEFNKRIVEREDIKNPDQLIKIYYDYPEREGIPVLDIKTRRLNDGLIKIILIHDLQ